MYCQPAMGIVIGNNNLLKQKPKRRRIKVKK